MKQEEIIEKLSEIAVKQERISDKLAELAEKQEKISNKLAAPLSRDSSTYIDKFMAVFALWAFFVALLVYFNGYVDTYGSSLVPNVTIRAMISVAIAALITFFFWLLSPLMVRNLIDSQKPFAGDAKEIYILLGAYFITVVLCFQLIPTGFSLIGFIILTILFIALYGYLSQNSIIFKKRGK